MENPQLHHCSQLRQHPRNLLPHESRTPDHQHTCSSELRSLLQEIGSNKYISVLFMEADRKNILEMSALSAKRNL
ncbi:hypothetical protein T07_14219 [Trichinella nelsoni]|uniref:Uncharacterized protein n=1 Tax=Trichinella nelsoni TaxID=6336 RepID=A0A0V0RF95_9BILA|nr:hypothetical protein T07_14219 [Trichinella nelsoni]